MTDKRSKYDTDPLDAGFPSRAAGAPGAAATTGEVGGATRDVRRTPDEANRVADQADAPTRLFDAGFAAEAHTIDPRERATRELDPRAPYPSIFAPEAGRAPETQPRAANDFRVAEEFRAEHIRTAGEFRLNPTTGAADHDPSRTPQTNRLDGKGFLPGASPSSSRVVPGAGLPENVLAAAPYAPLFLGAIAAFVVLLLVPRDERRTRFHAAQGLAMHFAVFALAVLLRLARGLAGFTFGGFASGLVWLASATLFVASTIFLVRTMLRVWNGEPERIEALAEPVRWIEEQLKPRA